MDRPVTSKPSLGQYIRRRRRELGLTQEELAARVGDSIRQSDISRLERDGVSLPRRGRLEHLARALGVSLGTLMRQSGWLDGDGDAPGHPHVTEALSPRETKAPGSATVAVMAFEPQSNPPGNGYAHFEPDQFHVDSTTLNNALSRAREVRLQTESVLRQSSIAIERARRTRRTR